MAKSSRATRIKKNNTALKNKVFGPVEQARAERMNERLLEIASKATPADIQERTATKAKEQDAMDVEGDARAARDVDALEGMDVDGAGSTTLSKTKQKARDKRKAGHNAKRRNKERNKIVFQNKPKGKRSGRH